MKRLVAANADVGLMATATNRFEPDLPAGARCPTTQAVARRRRPLHQRRLRPQPRRPLAFGVGRLRGRLAGDRQHAVRRPAAQRARRHPNRAWRHRRAAPRLYVGKEGGTHWLWNGWQHLTGPRARVQRPRLPRAQERLPGLLRRSPTGRCSPGGVTRETTTGFQFNVRETLDGVRLWQGLALTTTWTLRNFWSFYARGQPARPLLRRSRDGRRLGAAVFRPAWRGRRRCPPTRAAASPSPVAASPTGTRG